MTYSRSTAAAALLAAGLVTVAPAQAQPVQPAIVGSWTGELEVQGTRLPLRFHVSMEEGTLRATMDSPAQGAFGMPVDSARFADGELTLRIVGIGASYRARLTTDDVLEGEWWQGPTSLPLTLRRMPPGEAAPSRPQHPEPPFPYRAVHVQFTNPRAGIRLAGTLTLPAGPGPFAAVALVTGSGPQDRDETLLGHKPFLVLADHLTRAGIAVLRYDDRGVAGSEGDFAAATTVDFAGDAAAAVAYLRAHPEVDAARVGLIGHSEGGLIAPLVATGTHGAPMAELAFVVLLAGPALPGDEILRLQAAAIAAAAGATPAQQQTALALQARLLDVLRSEPDAGRRRERVRAVLDSALAAMSPAERQAQGIPEGQEGPWLDAQVEAGSSAWLREFVLMDPRPALRQLRVPVLALFGELDLQVPPAENVPAMRAALTEAGNADHTILELPRLNHLFQTATTGAPTEYALIEETFAPAALDVVSGWILERFGGPAPGR